MMNKINVFDPSKENLFFKNKFKKIFNDSLDKSNFILSEELHSFEQEFSKYLGVKYSIGVGNGLNALEIILRSLNLPSGSEVIVPGHTFIATWLAVINTGLRLVPVDSCLDSYNIDIDGIKKRITKNTKAIIVTHMYGNPVDVSKLVKEIDDTSIIIIEDAAQAHGSSISNRMVGSLGDFAAFSFYPTKNLGALGDGGAITFNNKKYKNNILSLRNYGSLKKNHYLNIGTNSRLDSIQASFLREKLAYLDKFTNKKIEIANYYLRNIKNNKITLPVIEKKHRHSFHLFVIRSKNRSKLIKYLEKNGVNTMIHYPVSCSDQPIFSSHNFYLPKSSLLSKQVLSLPCHPFLKNNDVKRIVQAINNF